MAGATPDGHDDVIRHVFAAGLTLHSAAARVDGDVRAEILRALDALDTAVRRLRELCFREVRAAEGRLTPPPDAPCTGAR